MRHAIGLGKDKQSLTRNDLGWQIYPEGLYKIISRVWKCYGKPIIITENGIADRNDRYRPQFIIDHVDQVMRAKNDGTDVRGYFHWSLLDNFEWDKGYWPRFGLYEVDRASLKRTARPSAQTYANIIKQHSS